MLLYLQISYGFDILNKIKTGLDVLKKVMKQKGQKIILMN